MTTAIIELETLPDSVRTAAESDDLRSRVGIRLVALFVGPIHVGRERFEFRRARVDAFVGRDQAQFDTPRSNGCFRHAVNGRDLAVAKPRALQRAQQIGGKIAERLHGGNAPERGNLAELLEEPRIDLRELVQLLDGPSAFEGPEQRPHAPVVRHHELLAKRGIVFFVGRLRQQNSFFAELE